MVSLGAARDLGYAFSGLRCLCKGRYCNHTYVHVHRAKQLAITQIDIRAHAPIVPSPPRVRKCTNKTAVTACSGAGGERRPPRGTTFAEQASQAAKSIPDNRGPRKPMCTNPGWPTPCLRRCLPGQWATGDVGYALAALVVAVRLGLVVKYLHMFFNVQVIDHM